MHEPQPLEVDETHVFLILPKYCNDDLSRLICLPTFFPSTKLSSRSIYLLSIYLLILFIRHTNPMQCKNIAT